MPSRADVLPASFSSLPILDARRTASVGHVPPRPPAWQWNYSRMRNWKLCLPMAQREMTRQSVPVYSNQDCITDQRLPTVSRHFIDLALVPWLPLSSTFSIMEAIWFANLKQLSSSWSLGLSCLFWNSQKYDTLHSLWCRLKFYSSKQWLLTRSWSMVLTLTNTLSSTPELCDSQSPLRSFVRHDLKSSPVCVT